MPRERRRVYYSGRVQGVGFRATSRYLARAFAIAGYVRNLPDGRVELVAEGELSELTSFLDAIRREFDFVIRDIDVVNEPPDDPPLSGFEIRH